MTLNEAMQAGDLKTALAGVQDAVRRSPSAAEPRWALFTLYAMDGRWEQALTQLRVLTDVGPKAVLATQTYSLLVAVEQYRRRVFAGETEALVFGEPPAWVGSYVQALKLTAATEFAAATALREEALADAEFPAWLVNGTASAVVADADSRLGPVLEAVIEGRYFWVPWHRIARLRPAAPAALVDRIWTVVEFTWANGGTANGFVPTLYPGSEASAEGALRMGGATDWTEPAPGTFLGLGHRLFLTDSGYLPLRGVQEICVAPPEATTP